MRIILDTETTGLDPKKDRVVEIAMLEFDGLHTHRTYHRLFNPQMKMPKEAERVHGLSDAILGRHGLFIESADELIAFLAGREIIAHNADFDMGMLNAEFRRAGYPALTNNVTCSLKLSKSKGKGPHNLDALCRRYGIDISKRTLHDAIQDCKLLAQVMIELEGGRQAGLDLDLVESRPVFKPAVPRPEPLPSRISEEEMAAHRELRKSLGRNCLW